MTLLLSNAPSQLAINSFSPGLNPSISSTVNCNTESIFDIKDHTPNTKKNSFLWSSLYIFGRFLLSPILLILDSGLSILISFMLYLVCLPFSANHSEKN